MLVFPSRPAPVYCSAARFLIHPPDLQRPFADGIDHTQQLRGFQVILASRGVCPLLLPLPIRHAP